MTAIEHYQGADNQLVVSKAPGHNRLVRQTSRELARLEADTVMRTARAQAAGMVAAEKVREVQRLAHTAMGGHAMLFTSAAIMAGDNAVLYDELHGYVDTAKFGVGTLMVDLVQRYSRPPSCGER